VSADRFIRSDCRRARFQIVPCFGSGASVIEPNGLGGLQ
jgi:hypothetical protein